MSRDEYAMRRLVAGILAMFGVFVLIDVAVIAIVQPAETYEGFRQVMLIVIGALLVVSGVVTFAWPKRGSVETTDAQDTKELPNDPVS